MLSDLSQNPIFVWEICGDPWILGLFCTTNARFNGISSGMQGERRTRLPLRIFLRVSLSLLPGLASLVLYSRALVKCGSLARL